MRPLPRIRRRAPLRILAAVLVVLSLGGCGQAEEVPIRLGIPAAVVSLDPRYATDAASARVNRLLYRRLTDFDRAFQPVPDLARWERLDATRYRFRLGDEGRQFHDGSRLTARDVEATYASVLAPGSTSPHRAGLAVIQGIELVDENTVDFILGQPDPWFPGRLSLGILPAAAIAAEHPFNRRPLGSGPFRLLDWPREGRLRLLRMADGQAVEIVSITDPSVRALKLMRGEVDLVQGDLPQELAAWLRRQPGVRVETTRGSTFSYLGFNLEDPVTGRLEVRRAIAHALDRQAIVEHLFQGTARPADALLAPDHWAGAPDLPAYEHDPHQSRALLAAAGYGLGEPVRISYKTSNNPFRLRLATVIQHQLREVGIEVDVRSYDWGTFYADIRSGRFQMFSLSWVGLKMPDAFRYLYHSAAVPPEGANRGRYASPRADALIEAAEGDLTMEDRAGVYRELQALLLEELPYVPLWYEDHVLALRQGVRGYSLNADGNYDGLIRVSREAR